MKYSVVATAPVSIFSGKDVNGHVLMVTPENNQMTALGTRVTTRPSVAHISDFAVSLAFVCQ